MNICDRCFAKESEINTMLKNIRFTLKCNLTSGKNDVFWCEVIIEIKIVCKLGLQGNVLII